jgi:hypothetical protein
MLPKPSIVQEHAMKVQVTVEERRNEMKDRHREIIIRDHCDWEEPHFEV